MTEVPGAAGPVLPADPAAARAALAAAAGDPDRLAPLLDALAGGAAAGDAQALELLVEAVDAAGLHRKAVRRVLVQEDDVEEAAQDTLVAVAQGIGGFRGGAAFTTWLFQVGRNRAVDHLRRRRATQPLDPEDVGPAQRISSVIAGRETARRMVERLPDDYRDAVVLRDVERLPYAEIAQRLDRNVNTVKAHVARGRALLATMWDRAEG